MEWRGGLRQTLAPSPDRAENWIAPTSTRWVWRCEDGWRVWRVEVCVYIIYGGMHGEEHRLPRFLLTDSHLPGFMFNASHLPAGRAALPASLYAYRLQPSAVRVLTRQAKGLPPLAVPCRI